jgi:hypothetical protein
MTDTDLDFDVLNLMNRGCSFAMPQFVNYGSHGQSLPNREYMVPFGSGIAATELESHLFRNGFSESPPDVSVSITPVEQDCPGLDELMPAPDNWDQAAYDHLVAMSGEPDLSSNFDMANILEIMGPQQVPQIPSDYLETGLKGLPQNYAPIEPSITSSKTERSSACSEGQTDLDPWDTSAPRSAGVGDTDALLASQESWPFFCCNRVPKPKSFPPKTAAIYVEGLIRVLTTQDWQNTLRVQSQSAEYAGKELLQGSQTIEPVIGHSEEVLTSVTRTILHKACITHCTKMENVGWGPDFVEEDKNSSKLPRSGVLSCFIESYVNHHKSYYACAADLTHPNSPILQSNVQASSLLMLLTIAQGAAFVALPAARYLASGLIEACRLFLFESIEKDILLSRDPTVLHAALLFTTAAAWSGDNWHMDIAMGQRGMYLSVNCHSLPLDTPLTERKMITHARMFNAHEQRPSPDETHNDPERIWEEWKELEERRRSALPLTHFNVTNELTSPRIAYSWVIVDQELSLFSDTVPLLNVVHLQAPIPSSEQLRNARSAHEWSLRSNEITSNGLIDGASLRDLFTRFVEGELSSTDITLSPLQLRLLLHPLQTLVCQLRQFLSCLPDSGRQPMGTSISKVAIKARLEEISTLLRQWYGFAERQIGGDQETCRTLTASLIMYHLIFLNTRTSLGFIEQFARGEIQCASARHASQWLQMHCLDDAEQIFFHCGQILRLSTSVPENLRPPWWSGAIYRVALIAWATSLAGTGGRLPLDSTTEMDKPFAIDALVPEHPSIVQYLRYKEGVPMLSRRDGTLVGMHLPNEVLQHCISILEEDLSTRATEGIMKKLRSLLDRWRNPLFDIKA